MKHMIHMSLLATAVAGGVFHASAAETNTVIQSTIPVTTDTHEAKVQKITFMQDDAQFNIVSKVYELKHAKAADLAPFVKSAAIRFDPVSTVTRMEDKANQRQMLIVSTAQDMMPYIDEMIEALDRPGKMNEQNTIIAGTGIAYGTYKPQFRSTADMRKVIVGTEISSGPLDGKVKLDKKTNLFYFKDSPARVADIKRKLEWLDQEIPQTRIEFKIYEVRDSDLTDVGIDYLAWKNGPGLNLFAAGYDVRNMRVSESPVNPLTQNGVNLFGKASYGFGGMYAAPSFDLSFIRILQQNGKATINSTASAMISNDPEAEFKLAFSPEYQAIRKDENHTSSVDVGGNASLEATISDAIITGGKDGVVNLRYALLGANTVERNHLGEEISENANVTASITLDFKTERLLASWKRTSHVEQTIGVPFLCELPILKYVFGSTTRNTEVTHYFVTARAVSVNIHDSIETGMMAQFDELTQK